MFMELKHQNYLGCIECENLVHLCMQLTVGRNVYFSKLKSIQLTQVCVRSHLSCLPMLKEGRVENLSGYVFQLMIVYH